MERATGLLFYSELLGCPGENLISYFNGLGIS